MNLFPMAIVGFSVGLAVALDVAVVYLLRRRRRSAGDGASSEARGGLPTHSQLRKLIAPFVAPIPEPMSASPSRSLTAGARGPIIPSLIGYLRIEILPFRLQRERLAVALGGLAVSTGIGLAYSRTTVVRGWQLWVWAAAVAVTCVALLPPRWQGAPRRPPWRWLLGLLLAGLLLRITFLETVPGWLHPDEAMLADYTVLHILPSPGITVNPFATGLAAQPTLHSYLVSSALRALGHSITALRIPSVVAGSLAILAAYAAIAAIDSRRIAILAATVMTTYHFHIHWSRLALNNIWDTLWVPLLLAMFAWGWKTKWSGGAVLAGLALGLSHYFHSGSPVAWFLLAILILQLWRQSPDRRRLGVHLGKLAATAACTLAPLALFALFNPEAFFSRIPFVLGWNAEAVRQVTGSANGWWEYLVHQATRSFGAYIAYTDVSGFYDPGVPFLFGVSALTFLAGAVWALKTRRWLPLAWVTLAALLGGFVLRGAPSSPNFVVSIPGVAWLIALPLDGLISRGRWRLALAVLAAIIVSDLVFYFGVYALHGAPSLIFPFPNGQSQGGL